MKLKQMLVGFMCTVLCSCSLLHVAEAACDMYVGTNSAGKATHALRIYQSSYGDIVDVESIANPDDRYAPHVVASGMMQWDNILVKYAEKHIGMGAEERAFWNTHYQVNWDEDHKGLSIVTNKAHPGEHGKKFMVPSIEHRYEFMGTSRLSASKNAARVLLVYHIPDKIKDDTAFYIKTTGNIQTQYPDIKIDGPGYVFTFQENSDAQPVYYIDTQLDSIWIQWPNGEAYQIYWVGVSG